MKRGEDKKKCAPDTKRSKGVGVRGERYRQKRGNRPQNETRVRKERQIGTDRHGSGMRHSGKKNETRIREERRRSEMKHGSEQKRHRSANETRIRKKKQRYRKL